MSFSKPLPDRRKLLALAPLLLAGCVAHMSPSTANFSGIKRPMMLGNLDRIGGGAPLPSQKVGEFEGKSVAAFSQTHSGGYETTTNLVNNLDIFVDAGKAMVLGGPLAEIRVTTLRTWAFGYLCCLKNTVYVVGDVVSVRGAK